MAFTEQEKQLILWGKQNGKTPQEVEQALARLRTGVAPKEVAVNTSVKEPSGFIAAVKDIPNDIGDAFKGSVAAVSRAMDTARDITGRVESGETSPLSGTLQTIGTGLRAGAETVGQGLLGIGKLFLPQQAEDAIGETVQGVSDKVVQTKPVQNLIGAYQNLSPELSGTSKLLVRVPKAWRPPSVSVQSSENYAAPSVTVPAWRSKLQTPRWSVPSVRLLRCPSRPSQRAKIS